MNDTEAFIRQLKIDLITSEPNTIIRWFNGLWDNIAIIDMGYLINYYTINHNQEELWLFQHDTSSNQFRCSYYNFWLILRKKLNCDNVLTSTITKILVENKINIEIPEPKFGIGALPPISIINDIKI